MVLVYLNSLSAVQLCSLHEFGNADYKKNNFAAAGRCKSFSIVSFLTFFLRGSKLSYLDVASR